MKKYIVLIIGFVLVSCASKLDIRTLKDQLTDSKLYQKTSKGFTIQKLPDWEFHGFHNILHYTPKEFMNKGDDFIQNAISASNYDAGGKGLQTIVDTNVEKGLCCFKVTNFKMFTEPTRYGESIIVTFDSKINKKEYKNIWQFYKYKNRVYRVFFSARKRYYDRYANEAIQMMKTFTITE
ncbi:MAG: hypothetical protein AAF611_11235 [Bacteroidota bacterium]